MSFTKYNKVFRGQFANQEVDPTTNLSKDVVVTVDIYDTTSGTDDPDSNIIELPMGEPPTTIKVVDNDESKTTVIRAKSADVIIHSSDTINLSTFVDGGDTRFFGIIYTDDFIFIQGLVSVGDIQKDFQPHPNDILLTINDGFGFLADEDLSNEDGSVITGVHNIWYYIRLSLLKRGYASEARVIMNIREETAPTVDSVDTLLGHFFNHESLESKTFEGEDTGTMIKCDEVLRRLLYGCFITQHNGIDYIIRIDEMQGDSTFYMTTINDDGTFSSQEVIDFTKSIGDGLNLSWMNDDAIVSAERPLKKLKLKRTYESFKEIPCNKDFERGTGSDPTGAASETIDYTLECWRFLREGTDPEDLDQAAFAGSTGVLRKLFEYNYEKDRYLVNGTAGGFRHYFKSEGIRMAAQSKINIGFQWRSASDTGGVTVNIAHMRLVGDDGNVYDWNLTTAGVSSWVQKVITDTVFDTTWQQSISGIDDSEQQSVSAESQPALVAGTLYIRLLNDLSSPDRYFSALQVSYTPLINGSYAKYTGEQHTVEQTGDVKALLEDTVYIGSGPDRNIKGTLLKRGDDLEIFAGTVDFGPDGHFEMTGDQRAIFGSYIGETIIIEGSAGNDQEAVITAANYSIIGNLTQIFIDGTTGTEVGATITVSIATYDLAERFYSGAVLPAGPVSPDEIHPYGELIVFDVWNQYNRVMRKFEGTIDHLDTDIEPPGLIHKFTLEDPDASTGTRIFMMLHFSKDLHKCQWDGFFHEVHDPAQGKSYTGLTFKYLTK